MQKNKLSVLVLLLVLVVAVGPVSAAPVNVNSNMTNAQIQNAINGANSGDTINFAAGTYNGICLNIAKRLNLVGNGAVLNGNGSSVMTISNTNGVQITGFVINIGNTGANGITGSNISSAVIQNNTLKNGGDAINIFMTYNNLTINNNTINNMSTNYGDGISLVNHATGLNMDTFNPSTITNNQISNITCGIFLGGNFKGTVSGNTITNSATTGMNITGKKAATNGKLIANITGNTISGTPIGIEMEHPSVISLLLDSNTIGGTSSSIQTNSYFAYPATHTITVTNNNLVNIVSTAFQNATTAAYDNTGMGAYEKL